MLRHSRTLNVMTVFALAALVGVALDAAKIKARAEQDPDFDFATVRTWSWDADSGRVIMARTATDDPAPVKARVDPIIRKHVQAEMAKKGLKEAPGASDVQLDYYVLVTLNVSGQSMGQFLPAVSYWGLPPFAPAATSFNAVTKGSLVIDAMTPGKVGQRPVVWRGIAQSAVGDTDTPEEREARVREATTELIKKFPLKKKKK